jgi:uncharacterized protein
MNYAQPLRKCLIVFTRYPETGKTKTRLIPALGADGASNLQRQMSEFTVARVRELKLSDGLDFEIHFQGGNLELISGWLGKDLIYQLQSSGDLGRRMHLAFAAAFKKGYQSTIIIGTDCPSLDRNIISEAFELLKQRDLVLGPATDGGYYLIGLNTLIPDLFASIAWSTSAVLASTVEIADRLNLKVAYTSTLSDIDRPEDLQLLDRNFILDNCDRSAY